MKITKISGHEIFDSRGLPTIECTVILDDCMAISASVPSGTSLGSDEAYELRDGSQRLMGKGVLKAIDNIEKIIAPEFVKQIPNVVEMDIKMIEIDGTANKSFLGANTMLAASMAICRAQAVVQEMELYELIALLMDSKSVTMPLPLINMINGGLHADNGLNIQEYLLIPLQATNFRSSIEAAVTIHHELGKLLKKFGKSTLTGAEGGFAPTFENDLEPLDFILEAVESAPVEQDIIFALGIDAAASQWYNPKKDMYRWNKNEWLSRDDLITFYQNVADNYPLISIEDGLASHDWPGWAQLTKAMGKKFQTVGDDLFVTNCEKIYYGIEKRAANAVIIKPNQVGTVTETLQAIKLAQDNNWHTVVSHRSGETADTFIADLAIGSSADQIKAGGCSRGERWAKWNRILAVEDELTS